MEHDQDSFGSLPSGGAPAAPFADSRSLTAVATPKAQEGTWTLIAPDGRQWRAESPLKCASAEQRERVPAHVAVARIMAEIDNEAPTLSRPKERADFEKWADAQPAELVLAWTQPNGERHYDHCSWLAWQGACQAHACPDAFALWVGEVSGAASLGGDGNTAECSEQPTKDVAEAPEPNQPEQHQPEQQAEGRS
jgi:hypothetical protein